MGFKEKIVSSGGMLSAGASVLGSYQLCHNLCLSAIALLSIIGITVTGMPLLFLTKVAMPFWIVGVLLLIVMFVLWNLGHAHFSPKLLLANAGLLFAGTPFEAVSKFNVFFWIVGGMIVLGSIIWALADKKNGKGASCCSVNNQNPARKKIK